MSRVPSVTRRAIGRALSALPAGPASGRPRCDASPAVARLRCASAHCGPLKRVMQPAMLNALTRS
eukprot:3883518-Alexandrium_andersonii.AAC.1